MGVESFRIDFFIYSCQSVDKVLFEMRKTFSLEQDYSKHFLKKNYITNTFILSNLVKVYLNYETQADYVYLTFEGCFSNYEKYIKLAYMLYEELQEAFPIRVKLEDFLNDTTKKIPYEEFNGLIISFYKEKYKSYKMRFKVKNVDLLPGIRFYKEYKKHLKKS